MGGKQLPKFASREAERRFWETHDPFDYVEGPAEVIVRLRHRPTRSVTMRMDEELLRDLKAVAQQHEVPYQRLARELLRKSVADLKRQARPPQATPAPGRERQEG